MGPVDEQREHRAVDRQVPDQLGGPEEEQRGVERDAGHDHHELRQPARHDQQPEQQLDRPRGADERQVVHREAERLGKVERGELVEERERELRVDELLGERQQDQRATDERTQRERRPRHLLGVRARRAHPIGAGLEQHEEQRDAEQVHPLEDRHDAVEEHPEWPADHDDHRGRPDPHPGDQPHTERSFDDRDRGAERRRRQVQGGHVVVVTRGQRQQRHARVDRQQPGHPRREPSERFEERQLGAPQPPAHDPPRNRDGDGEPDAEQRHRLDREPPVERGPHVGEPGLVREHRFHRPTLPSESARDAHRPS